MALPNLQSYCEQGQELLERMDYIGAEAALVAAEKLAFEQNDFDTLARLYMPLQEARRQRRQRCAEGIVCLDLIDEPRAQETIEKYPHGQLLVAGSGSIKPAVEIRALQKHRGLYVETFLAASYPVGAGRAVVIVPVENVSLPPVDPNRSIDDLIRLLPAHCIVLSEADLPRGPRPGDWKTYAEVMAMWERIHSPFLALADQTVDPLVKIEEYRKTIRVDYACEFAHQRLSDTARKYARDRKVGAGPH
jgi:hypothetical protein